MRRLSCLSFSIESSRKCSVIVSPVANLLTGQTYTRSPSPVYHLLLLRSNPCVMLSMQAKSIASWRVPGQTSTSFCPSCLLNASHAIKSSGQPFGFAVDPFFVKLVLVSESFCILDNHFILNHINTFVGGLLVKKQPTTNRRSQDWTSIGYQLIVF